MRWCLELGDADFGDDGSNGCGAISSLLVAGTLWHLLIFPDLPAVLYCEFCGWYTLGAAVVDRVLLWCKA